MNNSFAVSDIIPVLTEVIASGGEFELYPRGTSMLPLIKEGRDSVILSRAFAPEVGDIVLYRRENGQYVLHRIIGKEDSTFTLCGDNQTKPEFDIRESQILARVVSLTVNGRTFSCDSEKYRKWVKKWLNMPYRRLCLLSYRAKKKLKARGKNEVR